MSMPIQSLHIGMAVRHPQYGVGVVTALTELTADISFEDARRTIAPASSELTPAEPTAAVSELQVPLSNFIRETAHAVVEALGLEKDETIVQGIANRWQNGTLVLRPRSWFLSRKPGRAFRQSSLLPAPFALPRAAAHLACGDNPRKPRAERGTAG